MPEHGRPGRPGRDAGRESDAGDHGQFADTSPAPPSRWMRLDRGAIDYVAKPERGMAHMSAFGGGIDSEDSQRGRHGHAAHDGRAAKTRRCPRRAGARPAGRQTGGRRLSGRIGRPMRGAGHLDGRAAGPDPAAGGVAASHAADRHRAAHAAAVHRAAGRRLDAISALSVREAVHGDRLQPNCVLLAPGGRHLELRRPGDARHDGDSRRTGRSAGTSRRST